MKAMTAFAFLQWQDWNQGALIRDRSEPDHAGKTSCGTRTSPLRAFVLTALPPTAPGGRTSAIRAACGPPCSGMWDSDGRFRDEMLRCLAWSVNHRLTRQWVTERVGEYARLKESWLDCFDEATALSYLLDRRSALLAETV